MLQFRPVNLGPCLDEPLLRLRQAAAQALNGVHREDSRLLLVVRVEVRAVVLHSVKTLRHAELHVNLEPSEIRVRRDAIDVLFRKTARGRDVITLPHFDRHPDPEFSVGSIFDGDVGADLRRFRE